MDREKRGGSRTRKAGKGTTGKEVVLTMDQRVLHVGLALVTVGVFLGGLWLGQTWSSRRGVGSSQMASLQQPGPPAEVEAEESSSMAVVTKQLPKGVDPNLMGYTPADPDAPLEGDQPRIAIPELGPNYTYDLGEIPSDRPVEKIFTIKNVGTADLEIKEVGSSCGCTASLVSDKLVPPGGETELKVVYDPTMYQDQGEVERYIQIFSNDPAGRDGEIRFKITATVQ